MEVDDDDMMMLMAEKYVNEVGQKRKLRADQANDYCSHVRQ